MPRQFSFNFSPVLPPALIAAVAAALLLLLLLGSRQLVHKRVPGKWIARLAVLRVLIVAVLVLCLLQPHVSYVHSVTSRPDLLVLIDTSQSMAEKDGAGGKSRLESAIDGLQRGGLLKHLQSNFNVRWFAFDRDTYPVEESDIGRLQPAGQSTNLAGSLKTAIAQQQLGDSRRAPMRALLISDGGDSGDARDPAGIAGDLDVPVDTLTPETAPPAPRPASIVLANVRAPQRVKLGSEMQVTATLRLAGDAATAPAGRKIQLLDENQVVESQPIAFASGSREAVVRLIHRPGKAGVHRFQLQLTGESAEPYAFTVMVGDDRRQMLVLEDNWRWELKFLRRVVEDDPSFSFAAFLSRTGGGGTHVQLAEADRKVILSGFPQNASDLAWYDILVIGDVSPRRWPPQLAAAVSRAIKDEGKSLVVIAGPNLPKLAETPELSSLLPVEVTQQSAQPIEGPLQVRPSGEGTQSPFFFELPGAQLPDLDRVYPVLRKRPGATVLLEAAKQANADGPLVVMAEQTVGRGRVLYIGTDALWNWQMTGPLDSQGVTPYAAFWQQALRAMSTPQARTGNVDLALRSERSRYTSGERIALAASYTSTSPLPLPVIQGTVTLPDRSQLPLAFAADPLQPNSYRAEIEAAQPGQYQIAGAISAQGQPPLAQAVTMIDVDRARGELPAPAVNEAALVRIAEATRGRRINPAQSATWPQPDPAAASTLDETRHVDLWGNLSLLVVLCVFLGADWLLRLARGYV